MTSSVTKKAVLGLDIGGANLKAAHTSGNTCHAPFALWKNPQGLAGELRRLIASAPPHDLLAVTMTGELCDCFESSRQGVAAILDAVAAGAGTPVHVWTTEGFTDLDTARAQPANTASANWLALATFVGRFAPQGPAILIDIGTTTTDLIPLLDGRPVPKGRTDKARLDSIELLYRGWRRTPVCVALEDCAAELFATYLDVYLMLKAVPENPADRDTADGRPATRADAHRRLARMLCADQETVTIEDCEKLASRLNLRMISTIASSIRYASENLPHSPRTIISSGSGEFLMPMVCRSPMGLNLSHVARVSVSERLGRDISGAACAYAVAVLCSEKEG